MTDATVPGPPPVPPPAVPARRPRASRLLLAGAVVAAVLVAGAIVAARRGGDDGGCLSQLASHLPAGVARLEGTDLGRARDAGVDDGASRDELSRELAETGIALDPRTRSAWEADAEGSEDVGYEPTDVACWIGEPDQFVADGDFDAARVADAASDQAAQGALIDGVLVHADEPARVAGSREQPAPVQTLVETLDRQAAISFGATNWGDGDDGHWVAVALAEGDGWEFLAVWAYADADEAEARRADLAGVLADESMVGTMVEGDPAELLQRDGAALWLRAPLVGETYRWLLPQRNFDAMLLGGAGPGE